MRLFGTDFQTLCFFMSFSKHMLSMNLTFWTLDSLETQMNFSTDFRERPFGQSRFSLHLQLILSILPCHFSQIIYKSRFAWSIWTCLFNLDLPCQSGLAFSIQTCLFNPDLAFQSGLTLLNVNLNLYCQSGLELSIRTCQM